jgi:hypothetical protein
MDVDSFSVFTEFSVAITGFSGIALALTRRDGELTGPQRFRTLILLAWSLTPAFASTFPLIFTGFGVVGDEVWRYSSAAFSFLSTLVLLTPFILSRSMSAADRRQLSRVIWWLGVGGTALIALLLFWNALGPGSPGPILVGLIWHLFMSALLFTRLLVSAR